MKFNEYEYSEKMQTFSNKTENLIHKFKNEINSYDIKKVTKKSKFISLYDACLNYYNISYNVIPIIKELENIMENLKENERTLDVAMNEYLQGVSKLDSEIKELQQEFNEKALKIKEHEDINQLESSDFYEQYDIKEELDRLALKIENNKSAISLAHMQQVQAANFKKTNFELLVLIDELVNVGYPTWSKLTNNYIDALSSHNKLVMNRKLKKDKKQLTINYESDFKEQNDSLNEQIRELEKMFK